MTNALSVYQVEEFEVMQRFAKTMVSSGYFSDAKDVAQAFVKIQAGKELGIPPFASMTGIHIIQGKPALGANVIATLIKNDPRYNYRVLEMSDTVCRIQFYESGEPCGVSEFTAADARKAGTKNMDKFPKNMLFARAISNGAKWYTPGIFGGAPVYTPDELGADVDEDGNIVEGSYTPNEPTQRQPEPAAAKPTTETKHMPTKAMMNKLHALGVQKFGPEWDDARHELVGKLTEGRTRSSTDLDYGEVVKLAETIKTFNDYIEPLFDEEGGVEA